MSGIAMESLQQAIYTKLTGDAALMSLLVGGIHDEAPNDAVFPYLRIASGSSESRSHQGVESADISLKLELHSRDGGRLELLDLMDKIEALLDTASLSLPANGWSLLDIEVKSSVTSLQNDGRSWRSILTVNSLMEKE